MKENDTLVSITLKMWIVSAYLLIYGFAALVVGPVGLLLALILSPFALISAIVQRVKSK